MRSGARAMFRQVGGRRHSGPAVRWLFLDERPAAEMAPEKGVFQDGLTVDSLLARCLQLFQNGSLSANLLDGPGGRVSKLLERLQPRQGTTGLGKRLERRESQIKM